MQLLVFHFKWRKKGNAGLCWGQFHNILPWLSAHHANNSLISHQPGLLRTKEILGWQPPIKCVWATQMPNQEINLGSHTHTHTKHIKHTKNKKQTHFELNGAKPAKEILIKTKLWTLSQIFSLPKKPFLSISNVAIFLVLGGFLQRETNCIWNISLSAVGNDHIKLSLL